MDTSSIHTLPSSSVTATFSPVRVVGFPPLLPDAFSISAIVGVKITFSSSAAVSSDGDEDKEDAGRGSAVVSFRCGCPTAVTSRWRSPRLCGKASAARTTMTEKAGLPQRCLLKFADPWYASKTMDDSSMAGGGGASSAPPSATCGGGGGGGGGM